MNGSVSKGDHLRSLIAVNAAQAKGAKEHYESLGLQYVSVPQVVGITGACENIDTLFRVGNRLDLPLFLSQTGQLALEQALQYFHGVYTAIHSGRDEVQEDARHLREFGLTEEEFDCTMAGLAEKDYDEDAMLNALLEHIEMAVKAMVRAVVCDCGRELERLYGQDVGYLPLGARDALFARQPTKTPSRCSTKTALSSFALATTSRPTMSSASSSG